MLCTGQERACSVCCIGVAFVVSVYRLLYLCYPVYLTGRGRPKTEGSVPGPGSRCEYCVMSLSVISQQKLKKSESLLD